MKNALTAILASTLIAPVAMAQTVEPASLERAVERGAEKLIEAGLADNVGLQFVEDLTTEVGPRLAVVAHT